MDGAVRGDGVAEACPLTPGEALLEGRPVEGVRGAARGRAGLHGELVVVQERAGAVGSRYRFAACGGPFGGATRSQSQIRQAASRPQVACLPWWNFNFKHRQLIFVKIIVVILKILLHS